MLMPGGLLATVDRVFSSFYLSFAHASECTLVAIQASGDGFMNVFLIVCQQWVGKPLNSSWQQQRGGDNAGASYEG